MKEERLEVLRMVAEKAISVEEGERLLAALAEGEAKARQAERDSSNPGERGRGFVDVGRGFAGMSRTIASSVQQAVRHALRNRGPVRGEAHEMEVPPGTELVVENEPNGGPLVLAGIPGNRMRVEPGPVVPWFREEGRIVLRSEEGRLAVLVPATVARVRGRTNDGMIKVRHVGAPLDLETLDGRVSLELKRTVGDSRVVTLCGNLEADLGPNFSGRLLLSALDGRIDVDPDLGRFVRTGDPAAPRSAVVDVGEGDAVARLSLETASGDIRIGRLR
jgi:hypothetical protein